MCLLFRPFGSITLRINSPVAGIHALAKCSQHRSKDWSKSNLNYVVQKVWAVPPGFIATHTRQPTLLFLVTDAVMHNSCALKPVSTARWLSRTWPAPGIQMHCTIPMGQGLMNAQVILAGGRVVPQRQVSRWKSLLNKRKKPPLMAMCLKEGFITSLRVKNNASCWWWLIWHKREAKLTLRLTLLN